MKEKNQNPLSLKKMRISKLNNPKDIIGGGDTDGTDTETNKVCKMGSIIKK